MKAVKAVSKKFTPVSITVTFGTQKEIDLIYSTYAVKGVHTLSLSSTECAQAVNSLLGELGGALEGLATQPEK